MKHSVKSSDVAIDLDELVDDLRRSAKYRWLCEPTLRRIADWSARRSVSPKDAGKRAKRKLHQVYAAYLDAWDADAAINQLEALPDRSTPEQIKSAFRSIMAGHASCRERLGQLDSMYEPIFAVTGLPASVIDLGCGLHPLCLPWMKLPASTVYHAWDIDLRMIELVNRALALLDRPASAEARDVLVELPEQHYDVALLLKTIPCLQQQDRLAPVRLVRRIAARFIVVSFPVRSIGGHDKGMTRQYAQMMQALLDECGHRAHRIETPCELIYVVDKSTAIEAGASNEH